LTAVGVVVIGPLFVVEVQGVADIPDDRVPQLVSRQRNVGVGKVLF
jgi:hypothetical protein